MFFTEDPQEALKMWEYNEQVLPKRLFGLVTPLKV